MKYGALAISTAILAMTADFPDPFRPVIKSPPVSIDLIVDLTKCTLNCYRFF